MLPPHSLCVFKLVFMAFDRRQNEPPSSYRLTVICLCVVVFWVAELLDALCKRRVMNPRKRAAELRWDTPWPVLGENALYKTGPQTCSLVWATAAFLQLKTSAKSDRFPPGNQSNSHLCCCDSPHSCPKILDSITTTHPESCILPRRLPPQILLHSANVGRGSVAHDALQSQRSG